MYVPVESLTVLVNMLINTYFKHFWCSVIITDSTFSFNIDVPSLHYRVEKYNFSSLSFLIDVMELGCHGYVIQMSDLEYFFETFNNNTLDINHRYGRKRFIILPSTDNEDIDFSYVRHFPDIIFIKPVQIQNETNELDESFPFMNDIKKDFEIFSIKYVGKENVTDLVLYDVWFGENETFMLNVNLFPDKMANLQGRVIRISTFNYKPSSMWWEDEEGLHLDGTETRICLEYCRWVNCTIKLIHYDEESEWGELFENKTGVGLLGNVYHERADIGFSSSCMWFHEYTFLDLSSPYIRTGITTIAPRPKLVEDFLIPFLPFTMDVWIAHSLATLLLIIILFIYITSEVNKRNILQANIKNQTSIHNRISIVNALESVTVNGSNKSVREHFKEKETIYKIKGKKRFDADVENKSEESNTFYFMDSLLSILDVLLLQGGGYGGGRRGLALRNILLFYALFVSNAYMCGLTSTMTAPRYTEPIDTVEQLAQHNVRWGATHDAWIFSIRAAKEKNIVKVRKNFVNLPADKLKKKWKDDQFAYAVERLQFGHFATADYITIDAVNKRRLMGGDIYWDWYVAMFTKSSPFRPYYDKLIGRLHQTGLMKAWEAQVVSKFLHYGVQRSVVHSRAPPPNLPTVLGPQHMQGALLIWGILLSASFCAFLAELLVHYYKTNHSRIIKVYVN